MGLPNLQVIVFGAVFWTCSCFAQPIQPCFAFLVKGDLTTVCEGKTTQVTHRGDIENFAVSDELSSLAYVTSKITRQDKISRDAAYLATVVNLNTGGVKQVAGVTGVVSSCGGILTNQVGELPNTRDVVTGADVVLEPYVRFRCSSDRKVVAGITSGGNGAQRSDLFEGLPPSKKIAPAKDVYVHFFNVSPDGTKIAWFNDVEPICVLSNAGPAECIEHSTTSDPVSVNNAGELLAATGTGNGCDYKTPSDFSPARPGKNGNDECLGIGYWKAGLKNLVFFEQIGRNPQWLSSRTAQLLNNWSLRSGPSH